jgi:glycerophosphoryl diester phosphodiesterase
MNAWREKLGQGRCLRIGHRGAAGLAPMNTLRSFQRALEVAVDAVELDVQWTADRQLVVIHDDDLAQSTNGQGFVHEHTLAELRRLDAGEGEHIPTFDEVLDYLKGKTLLVVDLKVSGYEEQVLRAMADHGVAADAMVCSLVPQDLRRVRALAPDVLTAFSYPEDSGGASTKPYLAGVVSLALAFMRATLPWRIGGMIQVAQADGVMLYHRLVTPAVVRAVQRRGGFIGAWTVDKPEAIARVRAAGVNSITSNRPDLLV